MKKNSTYPESINRRAGPDRRTFLKKGMVAGAVTMGSGVLAGSSAVFAQDEKSGRLTPGDAALLRFAAAAEILETDFWVQYNELGGVPNTSEVPGGSGNSAYTALLAGKNNGTGVGLVEVYDLLSVPTGTPVPTATATATFTPGGTSPTPTATATAGGGGTCVENWDSVTAPALPAGWTATNPIAGDGVMWVTTTVTPETAPNDAFVPDQDGISDKVVERAGLTVSSTSPSTHSTLSRIAGEIHDGKELLRLMARTL